MKSNTKHTQVTTRVDKTELDAIQWALGDIAAQLGKSTNPRFRAAIQELGKIPTRIRNAVGLAEGSPKRPQVATLCGSTRFWRQFQEAGLQYTLEGYIVQSVGAAVASDDEHFGHLPEKERAAIKNRLDELHLRKIDLADLVVILNVDGYIGESTQRELNYAWGLEKPIKFLVDPEAIDIEKTATGWHVTPRYPVVEQADTEPRVPNGDEIYIHPADEVLVAAVEAASK